VRPLRLDLAGFAAFRDQTTVDFTDADFFALVGPTGSGKSTILDAVCFALYGTVPRWHDPRSVANALAPSAAEARVRLAFETAGQRYVATRVVRRDGKGRVKTAGAGLQRMPDGFDVRRLDTGLTPDDLGEVLAGTPSEMDAAVTEVVGLPYDQFVTCVVLPQGEFAEFLHAKPATRQQILVNLLGLSVYERVRERATARAARAEAELAATDRLLADLGEVDDAALAGAEERAEAMRRLAAEVEAALPRLAEARAARDRATQALRLRDDQIRRLSAVRPPATPPPCGSCSPRTRSATSSRRGATRSPRRSPPRGASTTRPRPRSRGRGPTRRPPPPRWRPPARRTPGRRPPTRRRRCGGTWSPGSPARSAPSRSPPRRRSRPTPRWRAPRRRASGPGRPPTPPPAGSPSWTPPSASWTGP
jgi:exonuclease SbcC